jgi:hypothetical protein
MTKIMAALASELSAKGIIDVRESFIDASFAPAQKKGAYVSRQVCSRSTLVSPWFPTDLPSFSQADEIRNRATRPRGSVRMPQSGEAAGQGEKEA